MNYKTELRATVININISVIHDLLEPPGPIKESATKGLLYSQSFSHFLKVGSSNIRTSMFYANYISLNYASLFILFYNERRSI